MEYSNRELVAEEVGKRLRIFCMDGNDGQRIQHAEEFPKALHVAMSAGVNVFIILT